VFTGQVVKVVDGDSLEILVDRQIVRVRLEGIDAPEYGQPFGKVSRNYLRQLCGRQSVNVFSVGQDQYGRVLGDVYRDRTWVNGTVVEAGMAWHFHRTDSSNDLADMEAAARAARRGLWADAAPVAPWKWRKTVRPSSSAR
jgi:micrococcal nuclease